MPAQANSGVGVAVAVAADQPVPIPVAVTDVPPCPPDADCAAATVDPAVTSFGFPRDTFWPQSAGAFVLLGVLLTLLSSQLVSPTRRLHLPRRGRRDGHADPCCGSPVLPR